MDERNVGVLPVCDGQKLIGMPIDCDITIGATAAGRSSADVYVDEVMSTHVQWCFGDESFNDGHHWQPTTTAP
jgi:CBS domain-containing protein